QGCLHRPAALLGVDGVRRGRRAACGRVAARGADGGDGTGRCTEPRGDQTQHGPAAVGGLTAPMSTLTTTASPTLETLAASLADRRTTSRALLEECLARIDAPGGQGPLAFVHVDRDGARASADAMDISRHDARSPGGSTSGGAVSVADGMAHAALGTDTGGSCRIPAAFCGLVGYKPTADRIPRIGAVPLSITLDSIGSIARSVACCETI